MTPARVSETQGRPAGWLAWWLGGLQVAPYPGLLVCKTSSPAPSPNLAPCQQMHRASGGRVSLVARPLTLSKGPV